MINPSIETYHAPYLNNKISHLLCQSLFSYIDIRDTSTRDLRKVYQIYFLLLTSEECYLIT
jgi:hypothetical protein